MKTLILIAMATVSTQAFASEYYPGMYHPQRHKDYVVMAPKVEPVDKVAFFCRPKYTHREEFVLTKVLIKDQQADKEEIVLMDYGTNRERCMADEARFRGDSVAKAPTRIQVSGDTAVYTNDEVHTFKASDVVDFFKGMF